VTVSTRSVELVIGIVACIFWFDNLEFYVCTERGVGFVV